MEESEQVEQQSEAAAPIVPAGEPTETPSPAPQEVETPDAPTAIPYVRFKEVNDRAKASEQKNRELEARIQSLEVRPAAPAQPTQQIPTLEQVLTAYEAGHITETQKDQWVVYHTKEVAKQEFSHVITQAVGLAKGQATTAEYLKAYPSLSDATSEEFKSLAATYNELLSEGQPANVMTQARALRMTFGPMKSAQGTPPGEHSRRRADTFLEGAGGGGGPVNDPLKDVPDAQRQYWKTKGYTKDQIVSEAMMLGVKNVKDYERLTKRGSR